MDEMASKGFTVEVSFGLWRVTVTRSLCAVWSGVHQGDKQQVTKWQWSTSFSPRTGRGRILQCMWGTEKGPEVWKLKGPNDSWHFNMIFWKWLHNQYICENVKVIYFQVFLKMCFKLPPFYKTLKPNSVHMIIFVLWWKPGKFQRSVKGFWRWQEVACVYELLKSRHVGGCVCAVPLFAPAWVVAAFGGDSSFLLRGFALKERKAPGGFLLQDCIQGCSHT